MRTLMLALAFSCAVAPAALAQQVIEVQSAEEKPSDQQPPVSQPEAAAPAKTQDQAPQTKTAPAAPAAETSRYRFRRVDGGLLRLDKETGQLAYCSSHTVGWYCEAVPEDRAALEKEIGRLQDEIAALKKEIAALRAPPPPPVPAPAPPVTVPPPAAAPQHDLTIPMPSHADLERARAYVIEAWQRLVEMLDDFQKDIRHKGEKAGELLKT